jgi:hypothetical protein
MKIELGHGIDPILIRFSLVARKVKFRTAGQRIAFIQAARIDEKRQRAADKRTARGEQKSYFHFSAPLL